MDFFIGNGIVLIVTHRINKAVQLVVAIHVGTHREVGIDEIEYVYVIHNPIFISINLQNYKIIQHKKSNPLIDGNNCSNHISDEFNNYSKYLLLASSVSVYHLKLHNKAF